VQLNDYDDIDHILKEYTNFDDKYDSDFDYDSDVDYYGQDYKEDIDKI